MIKDVTKKEKNREESKCTFKVTIFPYYNKLRKKAHPNKFPQTILCSNLICKR